MPSSYHEEKIIDAIVAGQIGATSVPLRGDINDDETIRAPSVSTTIHASHNELLPVAPHQDPAPPPSAETTVRRTPSIGVTRVPSFHGFSEFSLDTSFSTVLRPPTPPPSTSTPFISRSISFSKPSRAISSRTSLKRQSSPLLSAQATWPSPQYAAGGLLPDGRWAFEGDRRLEEVAEDGVLYTSNRFTPMDSNADFQPNSSISPNRKVISTDLSYQASFIARNRSSRRRSVGQKAPEIAPIELQALRTQGSDEWNSIMKAVLERAGTSRGTNAPPSQSDTTTVVEDPNFTISPVNASATAAVSIAPGAPTVCTEDNETEVDVGLDAALDAGLGLQGNGMNWYDLGLLSGSGHESIPSVYSTAAGSRSASVRPFDGDDASGGRRSAEEAGKYDHRLIKRPWWRRVFGKMYKGILGMFNRRH